MTRFEASTLYDLIQHQAENASEHPAILFEERAIGYAEFEEEAERAARMLLGLGLRRGDRLGLMFPNRPEMLILYFGAFRIGAIVVPINTRYQRQEIEYALAHSECRLLIVDRAFHHMVIGVDDKVASLERILVRHDELESREHSLHHHMATAPSSLDCPRVKPDDPAVIFYTSGSTSRPKGVTHTHATLLANARIQVATREIGPDTVWLVSTGVGYVAGLSGVTLPAFNAGCSLVLVEDLQPDNLLRAIHKHRADTTLLLPTMLLEMLESSLADELDLESLTACFVAGDECSEDLYRRFRERMGRELLQAFGMTECEGYLSNRPSGPKRQGTIGTPAEGVQVRLVDDQGKDVPAGEPGELIVKAGSVMVGYWEDPDNTAKTLIDGWLHGGDVASRDVDGFYTFRERNKEIIIHGGSNVGPHEVENVIDSHPDVKESCVVGVPDSKYGAILVSYVEWEPAVPHASLNELEDWVAERLAAYKVPDHWSELSPLPKTATGKIDRKLLHTKARSITA